MSTQLKIALAQINPLVGDIPGNARQVLDYIEKARAQGARVVLFPELVLTGYPPEDLLLRPSLQQRVQHALSDIICAATDIYVVLGYPSRVDNKLFNAAGVFSGGRKIAEYHKQCLPNYQVFDEKRYFSEGNTPCVFEIDGIPVALSVCEDIWQMQPIVQARAAGAKLMLNINASPFHVGKQVEREQLLAARAQAGQMPVVYCNMVGGQDELVFDGGSCVVDVDGSVRARAESFVEQLLLVDVVVTTSQLQFAATGSMASVQQDVATVYQSLVVGVRDYVNKNGFRGVVLGLSGGIDSALTLAVAVDALGAERVEAVMMPYRYTAQMSLDDAEAEATALGVKYSVIEIETAFAAFMEMLEGSFADTVRDTTEENLQARCRGVVLMALSNKKGYLVLTTGNKSEVAVGYCTLYGDMAGGFDVLKDVPKTLVYRLSDYRNGISPVIPQRVIDRPPSAELAPDQKDQDSLPPYDVLDEILRRYIEEDESAEQIIAAGFDADVVRRVIRLVDLNEYKRRQAAIGVRISQRGFGRDRRYPITNGWKPGV
ncbi:MAG TPA: NAD+ synthase [Pseudomonadales bacterium]|nr:NAD+ synthase [Pseudomonadales bacterium]